MREAPSAPRILVTGFGPFPGAGQNPTAELIEWLGSQRLGARHPPAEIATAIIPTEWSVLPEMHARLMADHQPDVAIHFGLRVSSEAFHIEQRAQNWKSGEPDATGERLSPSPVLTAKPRLLHTPYPVERLVDHLKRQGLPARLSVDAGPYICNMAYYLSLDGMGDAGNPGSALFVHIPPIANSGGNADGTGFSQAQLRRCARAVIDHALGEVRGVLIPETI